MGSVGAETGRGLLHIVEVLRRWWILLVAGTAFAVGLGGLAVVATPTRYTAESVVLVDQPSLTVLGTSGQETVQKLSNLMPTFAELGRSDVVLSGVRDALHLTTSIDGLRRHADVKAVLNTLTLEVKVDDRNAKLAAAISRELVVQLGRRVGEIRGSDTPEQSKITVVPLQAPVVKTVSRNTGRTLGLAFLFGFGFSAIAAFALERT